MCVCVCACAMSACNVFEGEGARCIVSLLRCLRYNVHVASQVCDTLHACPICSSHPTITLTSASCILAGYRNALTAQHAHPCNVLYTSLAMNERAHVGGPGSQGVHSRPVHYHAVRLNRLFLLCKSHFNGYSPVSMSILPRLVITRTQIPGV